MAVIKGMAEQGHITGANIAKDRGELVSRIEELNKQLCSIANNSEHLLGRLTGNSYPHVPEKDTAAPSASFVDHLHTQIDEIQRWIMIIEHCVHTIEQKVR